LSRPGPRTIFKVKQWHIYYEAREGAQGTKLQGGGSTEEIPMANDLINIPQK